MSHLSTAFRKLPATYWWANVMELFERWAWYGMFVPLALYLTGSTETGALGFTQVQKGTLMGTVVMVWRVRAARHAGGSSGGRCARAAWR